MRLKRFYLRFWKDLFAILESFVLLCITICNTICNTKYKTK
nr:MAG TPA: hypothetical protein [Caudoviricetes sp.]